MTQINLFLSIFTTIPLRTLSLSEAIASIRTGVYRQEIEDLSAIRLQGDAAVYRRAKEQLQAFTFGGTFQPSRSIKNLVQHSGVVHGDLDHLTNVDIIKNTLTQDPHVVYCFVSPSREGLKLGVRIDPVADDRTYKHAWTVIAADHLTRYGVTWDPSGKDISRLCYVSWDPACYVHLQAHVFPMPTMVIPPPRPQTPASSTAKGGATQRERYVQQAIDRAVRMIQEAPKGQQHYTRLRAARLLGGFVAGGFLTEMEAQEALQPPTEAQADDVKAAMKTIADGLAYGQAAPITYDELEAERQAYRVQAYYRRGQTAPSLFTRTTPREGSVWPI